MYAKEAFEGNFIGIDFGIKRDFTGLFPDNWHDFNKKYIPEFLEVNPNHTKIGAGLACGMFWTVGKGLQSGHIVLCPNGQGEYYIGEVIGSYEYKEGAILPHRRAVKWFPKILSKEVFSERLRNSMGSVGTVSNVTQYATEIEKLLLGDDPVIITTTDERVEDPSEFALEKHLEDFLVQNWRQTHLGKDYDIYEENGEVIGQQYGSDTGPIDILAISKDKKELLVVELKKGRVSDVVVGQIQRYMGYVKDELATNGQRVKGVIIGFDDDVRIQRALSVTKDIEFYTYKVHFKLEKKK